MNISKVIQYVKKHEHPQHVNNQVPSHIEVFCQECEWSGTSAQSLVKDPQNDSCPRCGNTELSYEI